MRKYPAYDWSIEQKWIMILLPLLLLYDSKKTTPLFLFWLLILKSFVDPFFPMIFLMNSWFPGMVDAVFQASFLCALLLFWLCLYHGLRQTDRKFIRFYLPKVVIVLQIWICAIILATWEKCNELRDPTYSHLLDTENYQNFKSYFFISGGIYCVYLLFLLVKAYSELRSMPFFDMRLRFLTLLMLFVISITVIVTVCRFGFGILEDNFVANLKTSYRSSAQFMCFYSLLNFYLYTMSYVYSPIHTKPTHETHITKDNPAFSMINDSDEEIVYGSDEDRPLNSSAVKGNDYDDSD